MACFIQPTGFFCAPIATTRGFLYSLDNSTTSSTATTNSSSSTALPHYIPRLSVATNNNTTDPSPPLLGVDGQPVNYQGPARLGQTCLSLPLPPTTDPLFQTLVQVANHRLNETLGYPPGLGAGPDVLSLRGDCEQGSYCDLSPATALPGPNGSKIGICREQLPIFHNCTSYMQCISLRCNEGSPSPGSVITARSLMPTSGLTAAVNRAASVSGSSKAGPGISVCLPSNLDRGGDGADNGNGNTGSGNSNNGGKGGHYDNSKFPAWMSAVIAMLILLGGVFILGLVRRRKKLRDERERKIRKQSRAMAAVTPRDRERERTISFNEKHHATSSSGTTAALVNDSIGVAERASSAGSGGVFSGLFSKNRKGDPSGDKGGPGAASHGKRMSSGNNRSKNKTKKESPILSATSSHLNASSIVEESIISVEEKEDDDGEESEVDFAYSVEQGRFADGIEISDDIGPPLSPTTTVRASNMASIDSNASSSSNAQRQSPPSRRSITIPRITTTLSPPAVISTSGLAESQFQEGESFTGSRLASAGPPSFVSSDRGSLTNSSAFSSSRRSSGQGLLNPANGSSTPPFSPSSPSQSSPSSSPYMQLPAQQPSSPISPISPISPRPPLSSGPSSRLSHRQSTQAPAYR
ncbi:hypothetical protein BGZ83_011794 [Gryganskiella cystojenkinii]|nr:hypothetical protein BGZ83_011794 [Gryganskiella cystojenkinii]